MSEMEPLRETLVRIADHLRRLDIPFHCTGGLVATFYGEPRFTQDIDLVVSLAPDSDKVRRLIEDLKDDYIFFPEDIARAVIRCDMFQVIDEVYYFKIDFHVGESIPGELGRSISHELLAGVIVPVTAKEDAILSKLLWIAKGSNKSRQDVIMMLLGPHPCDPLVLDQRAQALGVKALLDELRKLAGLR